MKERSARRCLWILEVALGVLIGFVVFAVTHAVVDGPEPFPDATAQADRYSDTFVLKGDPGLRLRPTIDAGGVCSTAQRNTCIRGCQRRKDLFSSLDAAYLFDAECETTADGLHCTCIWFTFAALKQLQ